MTENVPIHWDLRLAHSRQAVEGEAYAQGYAALRLYSYHQEAVSAGYALAQRMIEEHRVLGAELDLYCARFAFYYGKGWAERWGKKQTGVFMLPLFPCSTPLQRTLIELWAHMDAIIGVLCLFRGWTPLGDEPFIRGWSAEAVESIVRERLQEDKSRIEAHIKRYRVKRRMYYLSTDDPDAYCAVYVPAYIKAGLLEIRNNHGVSINER